MPFAVFCSMSDSFYHLMKKNNYVIPKLWVEKYISNSSIFNQCIPLGCALMFQLAMCICHIKHDFQ